MKSAKSLCLFVALSLSSSASYGRTSDETHISFDDELSKYDVESLQYLEPRDLQEYEANLIEDPELQEIIDSVDDQYRGKISAIIKIAKKFGPAAVKWVKDNAKWLIYVSLDVITDILDSMF